MNQKEIWKPINGLNNMYFISNQGRVKSSKNNPSYKGRIKSFCDNGNGYKQYHFCINKKRIMMYAHRLVAEHFIQNTENKKEVNHKDLNKSNNFVENLEWVDRQENQSHRYNNKKPKNKFGYYGVKRADSKIEKYQSRIILKGKEVYLGVFDSIDDAVIARDMFIIKHKLKNKTQLL